MGLSVEAAKSHVFRVDKGRQFSRDGSGFRAAPRRLLYSGVTLVRFGDGAMGMGSGILDTRSEPATRSGCRSLDNDTNRLDDAPNCPDDADG